MTAAPRDAVLDGLRGAAALAVVYYHYVFLTGIAPRPGGGSGGVLVFFVLSGYLITRALWRDGSTSLHTYRKFVRRRAIRLYPALIGMVIVAAPAMALVGPEDPAGALSAAGIVLTQLTAFVHVGGVMPAQGWLHTWSLTVEWVFYLLWPLAILMLHRRRHSAELARRWTLTAAGALYLLSLPLSPLGFYYLPVGNLAVMLVGGALALGHAQRSEGRHGGREPRVSDLAFLMLLLMVFLPSSTTGLWLYRITIFPAAAIAAYVIIDQRPGTSSVARRALESRPVVAIGLCSYSLYLWHLPVLWVAWWGLPGLTPAARAGVALAALVPVVYLSFRYLERPWLRLPVSGADLGIVIPATSVPAAGTTPAALLPAVPRSRGYPRVMTSFTLALRAWWLPN